MFVAPRGDTNQHRNGEVVINSIIAPLVGDAIAASAYYCVLAHISYKQGSLCNCGAVLHCAYLYRLCLKKPGEVGTGNETFVNGVSASNCHFVINLV